MYIGSKQSIVNTTLIPVYFILSREVEIFVVGSDVKAARSGQSHGMNVDLNVDAYGSIDLRAANLYILHMYNDI